MKIRFYCVECSLAFKSELVLPIYDLIRDEGVYKITCDEGHSSIVAIQGQKFEILFDLGCEAILDGYYREAINSFSNARERFFEFFIKVVSFHKIISESEYEKMWKEISNQSERQYGAFLSLFLTETGEHYSHIDERMTKIRNKVAHKGHIPSEEEALEYGTYVFDGIVSVNNLIKNKYAEAIGKVQFSDLRRKHEFAQRLFPNALAELKRSGRGIGTQLPHFAVGLANDPAETITLKKFMEEKKMRRIGRV